MTAPSTPPSPFPRTRRLAIVGGLLVAAFGPNAPARTESAGQVVVAAAEAAQPAAASEIERFCSNIADSARDRRYALQAAELETLQKDIDKRIALLEEKRAEYEEWLKRRDAFMAMAEKNLVEIYSKMRPDAAAERMAELDTALAASILMKLDPRLAGVILNEMDLKAAAALTGVIASSAEKTDPS